MILGRTKNFACETALRIISACFLKRFEKSYKPVKRMYKVRDDDMGIRDYWGKLQVTEVLIVHSYVQ